VLWNIDRTLIDVSRVARAAYAEAFEKVTGRPLVYLASTAGATDSEIFFAFLARNNVVSEDESLLPFFLDALAESFAERRPELAAKAKAMPGAVEALRAVGSLPQTVQTVVTGGIRPNAVAALAAFGLDKYLDLDIGGFGSENYPKASLIQFTRMRAEQARGTQFPESAAVYITHSVRDVEAARIARVRPIGVVSGLDTESQLRSAGAEEVIEDLEDVEGLRTAILTTSDRAS
jgi:phosphoglycolate phosphatase